MFSQNVTDLFVNATFGLRYTHKRVHVYTDYGEFADMEEIKDFPIDADSVQYEDNPSVKQGVKTIGDEVTILTDEEMDAVKAWIPRYFSTMVPPDITMPCYDPEDNYLFKGNLILSEIQKKKYRFTTVACDYPVAKYNESKDTWEKVKAIIREDGSYTLDPDSYCDSCILFMTEEEWEKFPSIPEHTENISYYIRYDFKEQTWKDVRTIETLKNQYESIVTSKFSYLKDENTRYYLDVPPMNSISALEYFNIIPNQEQINTETENTLESDAISQVLNMFNVDKTIEQEDSSDFSKKFYMERYKEANVVLAGQKKAWLALPSMLKDNPDIDLTTNAGWDKLIDKFQKWCSAVYEM